MVEFKCGVVPLDYRISYSCSDAQGEQIHSCPDGRVWTKSGHPAPVSVQGEEHPKQNTIEPTSFTFWINGTSPSTPGNRHSSTVAAMDQPKISPF
jgi:hypothetical protein